MAEQRLSGATGEKADTRLNCGDLCGFGALPSGLVTWLSAIAKALTSVPHILLTRVPLKP